MYPFFFHTKDHAFQRSPKEIFFLESPVVLLDYGLLLVILDMWFAFSLCSLCILIFLISEIFYQNKILTCILFLCCLVTFLIYVMVLCLYRRTVEQDSFANFPVSHKPLFLWSAPKYDSCFLRFICFVTLSTFFAFNSVVLIFLSMILLPEVFLQCLILSCKEASMYLFPRH